MIPRQAGRPFSVVQICLPSIDSIVFHSKQSCRPDAFQMSAGLAVAQQTLVHVIGAAKVDDHDVLRFEDIVAAL